MSKRKRKTASRTEELVASMISMAMRCLGCGSAGRHRRLRGAGALCGERPRHRRAPAWQRIDLPEGVEAELHLAGRVRELLHDAADHRVDDLGVPDVLRRMELDVLERRGVEALID